MLSNSLIELDQAHLVHPVASYERTARTVDDTLADAEVRAALQH
jgi:hypothetical protein